MNRTWHFRIRKTHRYLSLFIGIQLLLWTIGGFYFSWSNLNDIYGDSLKRPTGSIPLSLSLASPSVPMRALGQKLGRSADATDSIIGVQLIEVLGLLTISSGFALLLRFIALVSTQKTRAATGLNARLTLFHLIQFCKPMKTTRFSISQFPISRFPISRFAVTALGLSLFCFAAFAQSTAPALTAYYRVKDALVATDAAKAKIQATTLSSALGNVDAAKLAAADKKALTMAKTHATAISKTGDVDDQREHFEMLSTSMIALAKASKPAKAYVQFCPMAGGGKGASWLSDKKEVRNPYYGDKMLRCGSVKEEL